MGLLPESLQKLIQDNEHKDIGSSIGEFNALFEQIKDYYEVETTDSEVLLDYLDHMVAICDNLQALPNLFKELSGTAGAGGYHRQWSEMFSRLRDYVQSIIVSHYSRVDGAAAYVLYQPILNALAAPNNVIPIFTTNYDWVFEGLAESASGFVHLTDGFRNAPLGEHWVREQFDNFRPYGSRIKDLVLFKLHGSTSWYRDSDNLEMIRKIPIAAPEIEGSRASLIYPTQVKPEATILEPFKTAYEYLRETLAHAQICTVIGFSFRDPAINEVFCDALQLNDSLRLLIVEPTIETHGGPILQRMIENLGFSSSNWPNRIRFVKASFDDDGFVSNQVGLAVTGASQWNSVGSIVTPDRQGGSQPNPL